MVERRVTDGVRIARLLASELEGHEGNLAGVGLADVDPEVEPTPGGAFAYAVERDGERVAEVHVHPERVRVEFRVAPARAAAAAGERDLCVRPASTEPRRTTVYVEDGAGVKRALRTFEAVYGTRP